MIDKVYEFLGYGRYHGIADEELLVRPDLAIFGAGWGKLRLPKVLLGRTARLIAANRQPLAPWAHLRERDSIIAGFSWPLTAAKTVSIAGGMVPEIKEINRASKRGVGPLIEKHAGFVRLRKGALHNTETVAWTGNVAGLQDDDTENRLGEPAFHTEIFLFNISFRQGEPKALCPRYLYQFQQDIAEFEQLILAFLLTQQGVEISFADGVTDLPCVPDRMAKIHSSRADDIRAALAESGATWNRRASAGARAKTAPDKPVEKTPEEMRDYIRAKSPDDFERVEASLSDLLERGSGPQALPVDNAELAAICDRVARRMGTFATVRLACAIGREAPGRIDPREALAMVEERFPAVDGKHGLVREMQKRRVRITFHSRELKPLPAFEELLPPGRPALAEDPFSCTTWQLTQSRQPAVVVVGSARQLEAFSHHVLRTTLASRRPLDPQVQALGDSIRVVDGRRCSGAQTADVTAKLIREGLRVVVLQTSSCPDIEALKGLGKALHLVGERPERRRGSACLSAPMEVLVPLDAAVASKARPGVRLFRPSGVELHDNAPMGMRALANASSPDALELLARDTDLGIFRAVHACVPKEAEVAFRPRQTVGTRGEEAFRRGRVSAIVGRRRLLLHSGECIGARSHDVIIFSRVVAPDLDLDLAPSKASPVAVEGQYLLVEDGKPIGGRHMAVSPPETPASNGEKPTVKARSPRRKRKAVVELEADLFAVPAAPVAGAIDPPAPAAATSSTAPVDIVAGREPELPREKTSVDPAAEPIQAGPAVEEVKGSSSVDIGGVSDGKVVPLTPDQESSVSGKEIPPEPPPPADPVKPTEPVEPVVPASHPPDVPLERGPNFLEQDLSRNRTKGDLDASIETMAARAIAAQRKTPEIS